MTQESNRIAIYPLFNFQMPEVLTQEYSKADDSNKLMEKIKQGFQLSDKVRLRRIEKEELDRIRKHHPYLWGDGAHLIYVINERTFVIEVKEVERADRLLYEVLLAMRLHKTGSVFCKVVWEEEDSKILFLGSLNPPIPWSKSEYVLMANEIEEIKELVSKINKLDLDNAKSFRVACERFSRSCEERRDDDKIIDLAISFEALFADEDPSKLEYMGKFVGLGCSMLLGRNPAERKEINQFLIKAFNIRNKIVHGNEFKTPIKHNNKEYEMKDFSAQLQKYLRDSLKKLM